jgi:translation initiation factor 2B subunit (eIF-2B alpha/beta/delta family)
VAQAEAGGDPRGDGGGLAARAENAVDASGIGEPLERGLVVRRQDRPAVREPEARRVRVAVDGDHVEPARAGGREQARLPRAEDEQPQRNRLCDNRDVSTVLAERVAELRADRQHGASWMARRAVETLAEIAAQPAEAPDEVLDRLVSAGRELAASRPGVGAVAGAVGRLLAAAAANTQLAVEDLQRLVREEADALVGGRERAGASIAIQLRERLEDAVVLTHSASATVREALLRTPPERVVCTVSSPQDEGRAFAEDLRANGLDVELVEDEAAPSRLEWATVLLLGADTVFRDGTLINKAGTTILAEAAAAESVPVVVACEVVKLAPIDAADAPELTAPEFELTPPELLDCVVTEEGTVSPQEVRALVDRTPFLAKGYALLGL